MSLKPYFVILTGSKNNAGDFLIKYRAKELFNALRPDRDIVDIDAWRTPDDQTLSIFNNAKAIILMGGPALVSNIYPGIYKVLGRLEDITAPIVTMAVGWRAFPGDWLQTYKYDFTDESLALLKRIETSGYQSSVRDFHTLNVLLHHGFRSFRMTGCAALYDKNFIGKEYAENTVINSVGFSLGIAFAKSLQHENHFKEMIGKLQEKFHDKKFDVAFHHSLDSAAFHEVYRKKKTGGRKRISKFYEKHVQFTHWLRDKGITFTDISGSAENLVNYYSNVDLHIGYRVHAHLFMSSVNRLSILISEDGRGKAQRDAIGGLVIDSEYLRHADVHNSFLSKSLTKLKLVDPRFINPLVTADLINNLGYEEASNFARVKRSRYTIDSLYLQMKGFLLQLP